MIKVNQEKLLKRITLTFSLLWLVVIQALNELPLDVGDGIMHFNISQASWIDSNLFIHHWGKPLFILLSSTFAQFGMDGMVFFNIIIFGITVLIGWKILNLFNVPHLIQATYPLILISIFDYSNSILAGLTEPLFSLFIIASVGLIIFKKWSWFAVIVSFTPFLRSEGQLVVVLGLIVLMFSKQFKYIPLLFIGFILYGLIGHVLIKDFWWYFTTSPYQWNNDIYGKGNWYDYITSFKQYFGNIGLLLLLAGSFSIYQMMKEKKWITLQLLPLFFVSTIFFGIILIHSYFWANGLSGSLGLTRIATQGMPPFLLFSLYYSSKLELLPRLNSIRKLFFILLIFIIPLGLVRSSHFPKKAEGLDKEIVNASKFLKQQNIKGKTIFFHHPLFVFEMGGNPYMKNQPFVFYYCNGLQNDLNNKIKPGDIIVRDSHFGPQEAGMKLEEFESSTDLVKIKTFISTVQVDDRYSEIEGVTIYQYVPNKNRLKKDEKLILILNEDKKLRLTKGKEFLEINTLFNQNFNNRKVTFKILSSADQIKFVSDDKGSNAYQSIDLVKDKASEFVVKISDMKKTKLYFWNPNKIKCDLKINLVSIEKELENQIVDL